MTSSLLEEIQREHGLGISNVFHHGCEETGDSVLAAPNTNGRLRCLRCGAFCETSKGATHVEPHPIPLADRRAARQEGSR